MDSQLKEHEYTFGTGKTIYIRYHIYNTYLKYFNVSQLKLNGRPHPAIDGATTTTLVKELRPAVKMLLNDFYSFERRSVYSNNTLSPLCRFPGCQDQVEDVQHILHCPSTAPVRTTLINQLREIISSSPSNVDLDLVFQNEEVSTQFLLDCSSDNLVVGQRVL